MFLFVFAFDDWEGFHDVVYVVALDAVEVKVGGIEFASQEEAAIAIPTEGGTVVATVLGKGLEIPGGVGKFENRISYECRYISAIHPWR